MARRTAEVYLGPSTTANLYVGGRKSLWPLQYASIDHGRCFRWANDTLWSGIFHQTGIARVRPGAAQLRAAGWLDFGGCCGGGRVAGIKGFACGFSLLVMVDIGLSALAVVVAHCDTRGGSGGGGGLGGC